MFFRYIPVLTKETVMKVSEQHLQVEQKEVREDFNWAATIGVLLLMLAFISATFYVLISSLKDLS